MKFAHRAKHIEIQTAQNKVRSVKIFTVQHPFWIVQLKQSFEHADNWWEIINKKVPERNSLFKGRIGTIEKRHTYSSTNERRCRWQYSASETEGDSLCPRLIWSFFIFVLLIITALINRELWIIYYVCSLNKSPVDGWPCNLCKLMHGIYFDLMRTCFECLWCINNSSFGDDSAIYDHPFIPNPGDQDRYDS